MCKKFWILIWLLFLFFVWRNATAAVCFRDNFEEVNTQVGSSAQGGTNPQVAICTDPVFECRHSLSLTRNSTSAINSKLYCYADPNLLTVGEGCDLVYKVSTKRTQYGAGQFYVNLGTSSLGTIHAGWTIRTDMGKNVYSFLDYNNWVDSNCVANPAGWDTIELRLHLTKINQTAPSSYIHGTYDAYVSRDGGERTLVASGLRISDVNSNGRTTLTLCMNWVASGTAYTYWDDISIEKIPPTGSNVVFSDDLETPNTGILAPFSPWTAPVQIGTHWYVANGPTGAEVNTVLARGGQKSLALTRTSTINPLVLAVASPNSATPDYDLIYNIDVHRPTANDGHQGYIRIGSGIMGGWCVNSYGRYSVQHRGNWIDTGLIAAVGVWENIKIIAHMVNANTNIGGTYDVYVTHSGQPAKMIAYGYAFTPTTTDGYARLYIANNPPSGGDSECKTYWDNFTIERIKTQPVNYAIITWGDNSAVYGSATDSAMDTPTGIKNLLQRLKDRGYTGVIIRTDLFQHDQNEVIYNNDLNPLAALLLRRSVDDVAASFDVTNTMRTSALGQGLDFIMYQPSVYSNGAPSWTGWSYEYEMVSGPNEQFLTVDLRGKKQYMVPEYGYSQVRAAKVNEFHHLVDTHKLTGIIPSMRTEAGQILMSDQNNIPQKADQFGFNDVAVDYMYDRYGIDIFNDPNFDVFSDDFAKDPSRVELWRNLRGSYLTTFFEELRSNMNTINPAIRVGIQIPGNRVGPELGNWIIDWRQMVDQGSINFIVEPVSLQGWYDPCLATRGYITDVNTDAQYRGYIRNSSHPEIKLIKAGQLEYFRSPVAADTDGWQTFWANEGFDLAWYQRWQQWKKDLNDFGCIKFIEQDFDSFPCLSTENCGAQGDSRYDPNLRLCPGAWHRLGDGNPADPNKWPVVQSNVYYSYPNAARVTGGGYTRAMYACHLSGYDRTLFTRVDNLIENGTSKLEFELRFDTNGTINCFILYDKRISERKIGIKVGKDTNSVVQYIDPNGICKPSPFGCTLSSNAWHKIVFDVNVNAHTYSVTADSNLVCQNISYSMTYNRLNELMFLPVYNGNSDNNCYIDDVVWKWYPDLKFVPAQSGTYLLEDFETHTVAEPIGFFSSPRIGKKWKVSPADSTAFKIDPNTSFGNGVKSLNCQTMSDTFYSSDADKIKLSGIVTLDFDIYLRKTTSAPDSNSIIALCQSLGSLPSLAVQADSKWRYWNGSAFVDSNIDVVYETWNHVQVSLDCNANKCKIVVQPCGLMPILVYEGTNTSAGQQVLFAFQPKCKAGKTVCIDNIVITLNPPGSATNPNPANGAANVSTSADLSWTAGNGTTSHDIYIGTNQTNVTNAAHASSEYKGNQTAATYDPGIMSAGTTYYWRIDEVGSGGTTTGTVWSFTTVQNPPTFVAAGAVSHNTVGITPALPASIATNDILLLFIETHNQAISIANQNGGSWAQVANSPQGTTDTRLTAFWSRYNGTQGAPTTSDSGDHQVGMIIAVRGAATSGNPWDVTAGSVELASDISGSIPGATTTIANTFVVTAIAASLPDYNYDNNRFSNWTNANLTSLTERIDCSRDSGNGGGLGIATGVKTTAGAYGNTAVTLATSATKGMISIAIKP